METNSPKTILSDRMYNGLRAASTVIMPALAAFFFGLFQIWQVPHADQISGTIALLNTFVGALVVFAKMIHDVSGAKYDGTLALEDNAEGTTNLRLLQIDPEALLTKSTITFKVTNPKPVFSAVPETAPQEARG